METNAILSIKNLHKYYGRNYVLKGIDLDVPRGKIFALLGPNGAGKTTLIKSILNLVSIKEGSILIEEKDHTNPSSRDGLAYFPEKFYFYPYYTVRGAMDFYGSMYGLNSKERKQKIDETAELVGVKEILDSKISQISKGQLQRSGMACALMSPAKLFILDEPFSGLDPIGIKEIKDVFQKLKEQGKTVFINSHILSEVEKFVDEIAIINEGILLRRGSVSEVKGNHSNLEEAFYCLVKGGA